MQTLYDSESFVVMHMHPDAPEGDTDTTQAPQLARHAFEIVDKRSGKEVYLDGSWAEIFHKYIMSSQL